jgi:uncharacterized phage-associated protein
LARVAPAGAPEVRRVYELFDKHRGRYTVEAPWLWGDADQLTLGQQETIDEVLDAYGEMTARQLSVLSHSERPWQEARHGLEPFERGSQVIDPTVMADFYGALWMRKAPRDRQMPQPRSRHDVQ